MSNTSKKLFNEFKLNSKITLKNRIVMAPLTRCFAVEGHIPNEQAIDYYAKRADVGLIISEATVVHPSGHGYPNTPGIYTSEQIEGWKKITKKVHDNNGKIFLQLWHVGRVSHPIYLEGEKPVAPSEKALSGRVPRTDDLQYGEVRALETSEVYDMIDAFVKGARNSIAAGFDGVEIHGANGYLIDQFLRQDTNKRTDEFGGSTENRMRFALEIVKRIVDEFGGERVGIRLSPGAYFNLEHTDGDEVTFKELLKELEKYNLAYVHTGIFDDSTKFEYLNGTATSFLRRNYSGKIMACGSYTVDDAIESVETEASDLVAIGRALIANPDFVELAKNSKDLKEYREEMLQSLN